MGNVWIPGMGGGGTSSDELTATRNDVIKGKTAVTSDSNDEPIEGLLELTGDAQDGDVLEGRTYYNTDLKTRRTGTMPTQAAKTASLNAGESYTIPAGYHDGTGVIGAKDLASQTYGTATRYMLKKGETAWVKGVQIEGTLNEGARVFIIEDHGSTFYGGYTVHDQNVVMAVIETTQYVKRPYVVDNVYNPTIQFSVKYDSEYGGDPLFASVTFSIEPVTGALIGSVDRDVSLNADFPVKITYVKDQVHNYLLDR